MSEKSAEFFALKYQSWTL